MIDVHETPEARECVSKHGNLFNAARLGMQGSVFLFLINRNKHLDIKYNRSPSRSRSPRQEHPEPCPLCLLRLQLPRLHRHWCQPRHQRHRPLQLPNYLFLLRDPTSPSNRPNPCPSRNRLNSSSSRRASGSYSEDTVRLSCRPCHSLQRTFQHMKFPRSGSETVSTMCDHSRHQDPVCFLHLNWIN